MKTRCNCGGKISPNMDKIGTVLGGGLLVTAIAAAFGLGGGWLALGAATLGGNAMARTLLQAKVRLVQQSQRMGDFFKCDRCGRGVGVIEAFDG